MAWLTGTVYMSLLAYFSLVFLLRVSADMIEQDSLIDSVYKRDVTVTATARIAVKDQQKKHRKKIIAKPTTSTSVVRKRRSFMLRKALRKRLFEDALNQNEAEKRALPYTNPHPIDDDSKNRISRISKPIKASSKQVIPTQQLIRKAVAKNEVGVNNDDFDGPNFAPNNEAADDDDDSDKDDGDEEDDDDIAPTDSTEDDPEEAENAPTDTPDAIDNTAVDTNSQNNENNGGSPAIAENVNEAPEPPNLAYNDVNNDPEESEDDSDNLAPTDSTDGEKKTKISYRKRKRSKTKDTTGFKREMNPNVPFDNENSQEDTQLAKDFVELSKLEQDINTIAGDLSSRKRNRIPNKKT